MKATLPTDSRFDVSRAQTSIFYWPRSFLLHSRHFEQNKPYQRISMTVIVSAQESFEIATADRGAARCAGIVLGPGVQRVALKLEGDCFLIELEPLSAEYAALQGFLRGRSSRILDGDDLRRIRQPLCQSLNQAEAWSAQSVRELHRQSIEALAPIQEPAACDSRLLQVLKDLEEAALDEVSIRELAVKLDLSESRLRSLARKSLNCSLSQYVRWLAAWKIAEYWRPSMTLTEAAHAAGFHDLAHANHTINEMFGMSPSRVLRGDDIQFQPCFELEGTAGQ